MAIERTLSIIKPDAVKKNVIGQIYSRFEGAGLKVIAARMTWLSEQEAGQFYAVHKERPFFKDLVSFMTSGPVMIQALEGGGRVELRGFGAFSVRSRGARSGRNPRTGESVSVRAKHVPFFKSGKELRVRLNADD